jgi:hypothetical protein
VCSTESSSWRRLVRRGLLATAASLSVYVGWVRLLAPRETALRHVCAWVRWTGHLFRFRVDNLQALPAQGPAMVVCYHGFIPLDMYFFAE